MTAAGEAMAICTYIIIQKPSKNQYLSLLSENLYEKITQPTTTRKVVVYFPEIHSIPSPPHNRFRRYIALHGGRGWVNQKSRLRRYIALHGGGGRSNQKSRLRR